MKIEDLNLDVRAFNAVRRTGCTTVEELKQMLSDDPDAIRMKTGQSTFERIAEALTALPQPVEVVEQNVIVSPEYTRAMELHQMIMADKQIIDNGLYRMGKHLKEMRDGKLYKQHGYQNFDDYCKNAVGFNRNQAYAYIRITEKLPKDFVSSTIQIGVQKLSLLAMLDEPTREAVTETVDVESVTVKELKAQITALTAERDEKSEQLQNKHTEWLRSCNENAKLHERISELEEQVDELENQPVDHIVVPSPDQSREIELLKNDIRQMDKENSINLQKIQDDHHRFIIDLNRKHNAEVAELKTQLQKAGSGDGEKEQAGRFQGLYEVFQNVVDSLEMLIEDMDDKEKSRFIGLVDEYYRKNLLYLVPEVET